MRFVISIVAALMILSLAAFGIVSAQKEMSPALSQATAASDLTAAPAPQAAPAATRRHPVNPVSQIAQTVGEPAPAPAVAPIRMAEPPRAIAAPNAVPMRMAQATAPAAPSGSAPNAAAQPKPAPAAPSISPCDKPGGMGLARIVEIDTTGGPGFGFEHFKQYDFLRDKEVVLTFDDGPWPGNTPAVLKALADECLKATFFEIGEHATWHPEITKQVLAASMTVGTHTWSHKDLARNPYAKDMEQAKVEIEMGISAVHMAAANSGKVAPFFRFPALQHPPQLLSYLAERNIGVFSTDIDSRDFKLHKPEDEIKSVMSQLEKHGKGIILMHDFKRHTAEAMPELIQQLKAAGYKVVHMVPKGEVTTVPKYDEMLAHEDKLSSNNTRPENSVIRTIGE